MPVILGVLVVITIFYEMGLDSLTDSLLDQSLAVRVIVSLLVLAPLGLCLGMFMPLGLSLVGKLSTHADEYIAWSWAVNGFFSVIGSVLTTILSMSYGFSTVQYLALVVYAIAALAYTPSRRDRPADTGTRRGAPAAPGRADGRNCSRSSHPSPRENAMEQRRFGRTGIRVSELCLGTMTFGNEADEATSKSIVDRFLDAGGNFVDTANVYSQGVSEEITGRALGSRRDEVVLATKVRFPMGDGPNDVGLSRRNIRTQVEASLRRLGTEWIDLYQVHCWDPRTPLEETLSTLNDLVHEGKVRYIGASNFAGWHLAKALGLSALHDVGAVRRACSPSTRSSPATSSASCSRSARRKGSPCCRGARSPAGC